MDALFLTVWLKWYLNPGYNHSIEVALDWYWQQENYNQLANGVHLTNVAFLSVV